LWIDYYNKEKDMKAILSPSMMCAPIDMLKETLADFRAAGVEYLHIDVMDGRFVPNLMLGTDYVRQLRRISDIPLDVHLMIDEPESKIAWFDFQPDEIVSVHVESTRHLQRCLQKVGALGAKPFAALNPATALSALDWVWDDIAGVLVMTVNPGYAGQKLIARTIDKIAECRNLIDGKGIAAQIEVDGNVSIANGIRMADAGADVFVLGSSAAFKEGEPLAAALRRFREQVDSRRIAEE
jgi:ribulose-phosphate 3-epimerase